MSAVLKESPALLQLQFWDARTRTYVPALHQGDADYARTRGVPWRMASTDRPLKPKYSTPQRCGHSRTIEEVQREYCDWAQAKGLTRITAFEGKVGPVILGILGVRSMHVHFVDREGYFAVEESHE